MCGHGSQKFHNEEKSKLKSWELFNCCLLNNTANPAHIHQNWARLAVLFSRQILSGSQAFFLFSIFIFIYSFKYETIDEIHACTFLTLNILAILGWTASAPQKFDNSGHTNLPWSTILKYVSRLWDCLFHTFINRLEVLRGQQLKLNHAVSRTKFEPNLYFCSSNRVHKILSISRIINHVTCYTGCPVNWYSLSISIPDFFDGPIKKI